METDHHSGPRPVTRGHFAQFFDTDDSRIEHIAGYVATALAAGDRALLVLHPRRWAETTQRLQAIGADVDGAQEGGDLIVLDSLQVLPQLFRGGAINAEHFNALVATRVHDLVADGRPLRVYGELVDLLAEQGAYEAVVHLEQMWNALAAEAAFTLFCGYSAAHFGEALRIPTLRTICDCHHHVRAARHDLLATFLLAERVGPRRSQGH